jgi:hypothetical protein
MRTGRFRTLCFLSFLGVVAALATWLSQASSSTGKHPSTAFAGVRTSAQVGQWAPLAMLNVRSLSGPLITSAGGRTLRIPEPEAREERTGPR